MLLSLLTLAFAASRVLSLAIDREERSLERRLDTSSHCGKWDTVSAGSDYTLYLDLWGSEQATGSQCAHLTSFSGTNVTWTTTWSWTSGGIKSFTNIGAKKGLNQKLSAIKSIKTYWSWAQNTDATVSNVAYDFFTSSTPGGQAQYEVMIWLAKYEAEAISFIYSADSEPTGISTVTLAGQKWSLFYGWNGSNLVYSFIPSSGTKIKNFSGELNVFITYLITHHGLPSDQYLTTAQAGTEATSGKSVVFTTSSYSLVIS